MIGEHRNRLRRSGGSQTRKSKRRSDHNDFAGFYERLRDFIYVLLSAQVGRSERYSILSISTPVETERKQWTILQQLTGHAAAAGRSALSNAGSELAMAAARASYSRVGHDAGGILQVVPISGMEAPNVLPLRPRKPKGGAHDEEGA